MLYDRCVFYKEFQSMERPEADCKRGKGDFADVRQIPFVGADAGKAGGSGGQFGT